MSVMAVFFDYGNTLVTYYTKEAFGPVLERCVLNALDYLRPHDLVFEPAVILESARQYNTEREDLRVTPLEERLAALFSLGDPGHALMPGLAEAFMAPNLALGVAVPGARETLAALKARGIVTGIISNTPWGSSRRMWQRQLESLGLAQYLDHDVYCMDVGVRKPHPDIFNHAFARAGVSAGDCLFIGDDPLWDVAGAQGVGMAVALFAPEGTGDTVTAGTDPAVPVIRSLGEVEHLLVG